MRRSATALALAAFAGLSLGAQCAGDPQVSFEVNLPSSLSGPAQWMEIGVFSGGCPPASELAGGLPQTGMVERVAFGKGNTDPPSVGKLKKGSYAFAAAARAADCSVLATGCTQVDLSSARDVSIDLTAVAKPAGACEAGETCFDAQCSPSPGGVDASAGGRCAMGFVAAGPLGDPLDPGAEIASTPAVAATAAGFLVAYREYDSSAGTAQITFAAIDPGGGETLTAPAPLPTQCMNPGEADALGIAFQGASGTVVSARPTCGTQPAGFDALQVGADGKITGMAFGATPGGQPTLSNGHALAMASATAGWLAYLESGRAHVTAFSGTLPQGSATVFGGGAPQSLALVAGTAQGLSLLSGGTGATTDGGPSGTPSLELSTGASLAAQGKPVVFAGSLGALTMAGGRAIAIGDSGQSLAWQALDPGAGTASSATFPTPHEGALAGIDVAVQGDLAAMAVEQPGAISVVVVDHASTAPTPLRAVDLSSDPRVPSQANVHDGKVAIAMSSTQVLVAWVTEAKLGPDDATGGWALYACAP